LKRSLLAFSTLFFPSNHLSPHHSQRIKQARKLSKYIVHTCTVVKKKKSIQKGDQKREERWDGIRSVGRRLSYAKERTCSREEKLCPSPQLIPNHRLQ